MDLATPWKAFAGLAAAGTLLLKRTAPAYAPSSALGTATALFFLQFLAFVVYRVPVSYTHLTLPTKRIV